ncbi:MAG: hypothetical protein JST25_03630 [Actinobacteria bacterium]|nr:hypothetical protein [Actinomycetota bacterium]
MIARGRLLARLDEAVDEHMTTVIAAPSGYGKTVLLAEWARRRPATTAWLTLTRHDHGDEALVLHGILSALSRFVDPGSHSLRRAPLGPDADPRALIGRIAEITGELDDTLVVIIDDAQHAGAAIAGDVVDVLTALTAGRLRFVLGGTQELSAWFSRTIAGQETAVLSATDLALTEAEIIRDSAGTPSAVDPITAARLVAATGGWPIAVHLHQLAGDPGSASTAQDALLTDYIAGNVLPRLKPGLADFILATSVCTRLTPALAHALSGVDDAEALLEECVAQGLFLQRYVDANGSRVYRWHDEFAARCGDILTQTDSGRRRRLDAVAAHWLAPHYPAEAMRHAVKAREPELALDILRSSWVRAIVESGARALNTQCLALPAELAAHPDVLLIRACCLNQLGDHVGATLLTAQATAAAPDDASFEVTRAFAMLFLADAQPVLASAADTARGMLEQSRVSPTVQAYCLFLLGWAELRLRRDPSRAIRLLESALHEAEAGHHPALARRTSANLLFALAYAGSLRRARLLIDRAPHRLDAAEDWHHYDGGIELFAIGYTAYWQNRLEEAQTAFQTLVDGGGHDASYTALARVYLALCAAIDGRPTAVGAARDALAGVSPHEQHGVPWPVYQAFASAALSAASGDSDRALSLLEPIRVHPNVPIVRVVSAEIMRRGGRPADAGRLLSALTAAELSISYVAASAYVTAALIAQDRGDAARAHRLLERALDAGAPEGVTLPFATDDEELRGLMARHAAAGTAHEEFLAARLAEHDSRTARHVDLGSVLSAREREIYGYLRTTMTATEIGAALFVSVNTVRTHQRAIYRKLGVANRREAIRLGL